MKKIIDYLKKQKELIKNEDIIKILSEEEIFKKFYDFDKNKESFGNHVIEDYLNIMYNLFENSEYKINEIYKKRFNLLMQKYSLLIKKEHEIIGEKTFESLNEKIRIAITKNINTSDSKFIIARKLYLNSCLILNYDIEYLFYNSVFNMEKIEDKINILNSIKYKKLREITTENHKVICTTWAKMYARLLCEYGIMARVIGDYHKYVVFDCDGTLMMADATQSTNNKEYNIFLNDLTRVKLNATTKSYRCLEKNKIIDKILENVDQQIGYKSINLERLEKEFLSSYNTVVNFNQEKSILFKDFMAKIYAILKMLKSTGMEKMLAIKIYLKLLYNFEKEDNLDSFLIIKDDELKEINLLITYRYSNDFIYCLIEENNIIYLSREELKMMLNNNYYLVNKNEKDIPGFEETRKLKVF